MIPYPDIDPIAVQLGPLAIRWYGLMYIIGFAIAWALARHRAKQPGSGWTPQQVDDLIFYCAIGVIVGGRLGSILFYNFDAWTRDPLMLLRIWQGGMSFHGGLLGVLLAVWLYGRKLGKTFFEMTDFIAPLAPLGLAFGRLGNFINGELWGKPTDVPWGFVVDGTTRHASQLYQAGLEGVTLFLVLWFYSARRPPRMAVSGMFALGYGVFRFAVEFVRLPDAHIGYLAWGWLTMGQVLSTPLILLGVVLLWLAYRSPRRSA
ncbi:prolipoprotein diacylglyceryl transferase [Thioalkalivibrio sp. XN279]|uniref:prolipoprotein diacylglyceryl transferase n=1 Tax=Thioalkalivibrio sp. XN279 TaxID=2714953 RepID=UPI00140B2940|nr:prolipoprotein diacylglyceryl transferase [Thioalkalivibrio sp. XN279]NHA15123.1 prolipoprotein diacylglyceryl transferase [Thioalkalivibrio sp. XN279]